MASNQSSDCSLVSWPAVCHCIISSCTRELTKSLESGDAVFQHDEQRCINASKEGHNKGEKSGYQSEKQLKGYIS